MSLTSAYHENLPASNSGPTSSTDDNVKRLSSLFSEASITYDWFKKSGLHFVHMNVRSILPKVCDIQLFLNNTKISVLCLSET